jgi:hypothetical protein
VIQEVVKTALPRLSAHLSKCMLDTSIFTIPWIVTLFTKDLSVEASADLLDVLLMKVRATSRLHQAVQRGVRWQCSVVRDGSAAWCAMAVQRGAH